MSFFVLGSLMLDEVQAPATPPVSSMQPIQPSARNIIPPTAQSQSKFTLELESG